MERDPKREGASTMDFLRIDGRDELLLLMAVSLMVDSRMLSNRW